MRRYTVLPVLVALSTASTAAMAQCEPTWLGGPGQGVSGVDGEVSASTLWDADGLGAAPPVLVIAGEFTAAGSATASHIATWNGTDYAPLGTGLNGTVHALCTYAGSLYAAGAFTASGQSPVARIARWDGQSWAPLGTGMDNTVYALAEYNGELVACGYMTSAGGTQVSRIARWNGATWAPLGLGVQNGLPRSLGVYNNELFVGGNFVNAGGITTINIARWNGTVWQPVGSHVAGTVQAMAVLGGSLYAAGTMTNAGGVSVNNIARWNGSAWSAVGSGTNSGSEIRSLLVRGNDLYAGGTFVQAGGNQARGVAYWNGSVWQSVGAGVWGAVNSLAVHGGRLVAAGAFAAGEGASVAMRNIGSWDGNTWRALTPNVNDDVVCATVHNDRLTLGGLFKTAGAVDVNFVTQWDGAVWHTMGAGFTGPVRCLAVYNDEVIAGGPPFTLARFDGQNWQDMFSYAGDPAAAMVVFQNDLVVADGRYNGSGYTSRLRRFTGTEWQPMGLSWQSFFATSGPAVKALAVYRDQLYAAGSFIEMGGVPINRVAVWTGSAWTPVGAGIGQFTVEALVVHNDRLIAAGYFQSAGGQPATNIASWDGVSWTPVGTSLNPAVSACTALGNDLIVGGAFSTAGGVNANRVARWTGTQWQALAGGVGHGTAIMGPAGFAHFRGELIAYGNFEGGNDLTRTFWARWTETGVPVITAQPLAVAVQGTQNASFHSTAAGYSQLSHQWRRNGASLSDGPTSAGSSYSGSQSPTLTLTHIHESDAGVFDCIVTSPCGNLASLPAQLTVICYANCDESTAPPILTANDFVCFLVRYVGAHPLANCDGSTTTPQLTANDFLCFLTRFAQSCQ
jgi:trimeric autotransporter adhesin